jgi:hypothetical protein
LRYEVKDNRKGKILIPQRFLTVHEFAQVVGRYPNYIYLLAKKGNQYRKLKSKKLAGKIMIPASEIDEFPFTTRDKVRMMTKEISKLKGMMPNDN